MSGEVESALAAIGVRCTVERRGSLAVLTPVRGDRALERPDVRRDALALLRAHGFTHAAVEVEAAGAEGDDRP
jgi:hypothetical protein